MEEILRYNGIDVMRCTNASVSHSPEHGVTEITVTLLALKPKDES